jgi:hypothetical protein
MTDTNNAPAQQQQQGNAGQQAEQAFKLKRHGKEHEVPLPKAIDLAQKGLDYEIRMSELKTKEEALAQDGKRYEDYKRLRQHLESNPQVAKAVAMALDQPDAVLQRATQRKAEPQADDDEVAEAPAPQPSLELNQLQRELAEVRGKLAERDSREQSQAVEQRIKKEIADYPWLTGKQADLAYRQAVAFLRDNPRDSLESAVSVVASEFKEAMEERQKDSLAKSRSRESFRTESPSRGSPVATTPPKMDKGSFNNGKLHQAAMDAARQFGLID